MAALYRLQRAARVAFPALGSGAAASIVVAMTTVPEPGQWVTYAVPGTVQSLCARVDSVHVGVDGLPWAWIVERDHPMRIYKVSVQDLAQGCSG